MKNIFFAINRASITNTTQNSYSKILFKSETAKSLDFEAREEYIWKESSPVGEHAHGKFEFDNGVINILRFNLHGRYIIKISKYLSVDHDRDSIKMDIMGSAIGIVEIKF